MAKDPHKDPTRKPGDDEPVDPNADPAQPTPPEPYNPRRTG